MAQITTLLTPVRKKKTSTLDLTAKTEEEYPGGRNNNDLNIDRNNYL